MPTNDHTCVWQFILGALRPDLLVFVEYSNEGMPAVGWAMPGSHVCLLHDLQFGLRVPDLEVGKHTYLVVSA